MTKKGIVPELEAFWKIPVVQDVTRLPKGTDLVHNVFVCYRTNKYSSGLGNLNDFCLEFRIWSNRWPNPKCPKHKQEMEWIGALFETPDKKQYRTEPK